MKKAPEDQLSKVASECADKLRGMDAVIPPAPPSPKESFWDTASKALTKIAEGFQPYPPIPFEFQDDTFDRMLDLAAVVMFAAGFLALGMALGAVIR